MNSNRLYNMDVLQFEVTSKTVGKTDIIKNNNFSIKIIHFNNSPSAMVHMEKEACGEH